MTPSSFLLLSFSIILPYLIVDLKLCNRTAKEIATLASAPPKWAKRQLLSLRRSLLQVERRSMISPSVNILVIKIILNLFKFCHVFFSDTRDTFIVSSFSGLQKIAPDADCYHTCPEPVFHVFQRHPSGWHNIYLWQGGFEGRYDCWAICRSGK